MKLKKKISNSIKRIKNIGPLLTEKEAEEAIQSIIQINDKMVILLKVEKLLSEILDKLNKNIDEFEKRK